MKRFYITVTDNCGSIPENLLVNKKELENIKKFNPHLNIKVNYELIGKNYETN